MGNNKHNIMDKSMEDLEAEPVNADILSLEQRIEHEKDSSNINQEFTHSIINEEHFNTEWQTVQEIVETTNEENNEIVQIQEPPIEEKEKEEEPETLNDESVPIETSKI